MQATSSQPLFQNNLGYNMGGNSGRKAPDFFAFTPWTADNNAMSEFVKIDLSGEDTEQLASAREWRKLKVAELGAISVVVSENILARRSGKQPSRYRAHH
jgi:hypothetical protein